MKFFIEFHAPSESYFKATLPFWHNMTVYSPYKAHTLINRHKHYQPVLTLTGHIRRKFPSKSNNKELIEKDKFIQRCRLKCWNRSQEFCLYVMREKSLPCTCLKLSLSVRERRHVYKRVLQVCII